MLLQACLFHKERQCYSTRSGAPPRIARLIAELGKSAEPPRKRKGGCEAPWKRGRGLPAPPLRALPPMGADAPCASAASRPPADWLRSTLGDGGLSCRVRDGIGRSPPPWPRSRRAPPARPGLPGRPGGRIASFGRRSSSRDRPPRGTRGREARARAISTARLNASRRLQLRPIDLVVYEGPYRRENSSRRRLPA